MTPGYSMPTSKMPCRNSVLGLNQRGCPLGIHDAGFFRFLVVRKSIASQRLLVNLVTTSDDIADFDSEAFVGQLELLGDRIQGVLHTINDDKGERVEARAGASSCIFGDPHATETLHGLDFDVEMAASFKPIPPAERLYQMTVDEATADWIDGATSDGYVMDLFCGTGTIGQLLARASNRKVIEWISWNRPLSMRGEAPENG